MDKIPLNSDERALGFTHAIRVTHADLTETAAATAQTLQIHSVVAGDVLLGAATRVGQAFKHVADPAFNTTTLIVGDTGDTDRAIVLQELNENGTEVLYKANANTLPFAFTAAGTIDAIFGSMAAKSLVNLDTGSVTILLKMANLNQLAGAAFASS